MMHNVEKAPRLLRTECSINVFTLLSRLKQVNKLTSIKPFSTILLETFLVNNVHPNVIILSPCNPHLSKS